MRIAGNAFMVGAYATVIVLTVKNRTPLKCCKASVYGTEG